jgi:flagellar protein FliL
MDLKKIIIISLIAFLVTAGIASGLLYVFVFRSASDDEKPMQTYEYLLGSFSTNLGTQRSFFNGEIVIETTDKKLFESLDKKNAILRDRVIKTLIGKKAEDVLDPDGQQALRAELIMIVGETVQSDQITNVYFVDYIVQ